jgi:hypothetical protein
MLLKLSLIFAGLFFAFVKDNYHSNFHRNTFFLILFAFIGFLVIG